MNRSRIARALALVLAAVLLTGAPGCKKAGLEPLPDDLLALLPAEPAVLVTLSSLDDWNLRLAALSDDSRGDALLPAEAAREMDLAARLAEMLPGTEGVVDPRRPLALAAGLPAPFTNQVDMVLLLPLQDGAPTTGLIDGENFHSELVHGDYVALSSQESYAPGDETTFLALEREPGLVSMAMDLEGSLAMYRPMIEMGLAAMAALPADQEGSMTPEEAKAAAEMIRLVMDAARRTDLALDLDDEALTMRSRFDMVPDSPLAAGPQPDFARALALTAFLPADAHLKAALAMDMSATHEMSRDYYRTSLAADLQDLPPDLAAGLAQWMELYLDMAMDLNVPLAVAKSVDDDGLSLQAVVDTPDAATLMDHLDGQLHLLGDLGLGLLASPVAPYDLGGVSVRGWDLTWDPEALSEMMGDLSDEPAADHGQLMMTMALLHHLTPNLRMGAVAGLLVVADDVSFPRLVAAVHSPGKPDSRLAALAAAGGPTTREAFQGDISQVLIWLLEAMMGPDAERIARLQAHPMDLAGLVTLDGPRTGFQLTMGVDGIREMIHVANEVVAARNRDHP